MMTLCCSAIPTICRHRRQIHYGRYPLAVPTHEKSVQAHKRPMILFFAGQEVPPQQGSASLKCPLMSPSSVCAHGFLPFVTFATELSLSKCTC